MKEWYSATEAAKLPGLPDSETGVQRKAKRDAANGSPWQERSRAGKGGGKEYHWRSLPTATQRHLIEQEAAENTPASCALPVDHPVIKAAQNLPAPSTPLKESQALTKRQTSVAEARLWMVKQIENRTHGERVQAAIDAIVEKIGNGTAPYASLSVIANARHGATRTLTASTLMKWWSTWQRTKDLHALAPQDNDAKRVDKELEIREWLKEYKPGTRSTAVAPLPSQVPAWLPWFLDAYLTNYDFSGRPITIRAGEQGGAFPAGYPVQLVAVVDGVTVSLREMAVKLKSPRANWEQPVATATYAGTGGIEGDASLKGTAKPLVMGYASPVPAVLIDKTLLVYQYNSPDVLYESPHATTYGTDIMAVSVTEGANTLDRHSTIYQTVTDMQAETSASVALWPTGIDYKLCPTAGMFRLRNTAKGKISCTVTPGWSLWSCLVTLVTMQSGTITNNYASIGFGTPGLNSKILTLNMLAGAVIASGKTVSQLMDELTSSAACWWGFKADGSVLAGAYPQDLAGTPAASIGYSDIVSFTREAGALYWRVIVRNNHNFDVHTAADVLAVTPADSAIAQAYTREWSDSIFEGAAFKARHPSAAEMTVDSVLYRTATNDPGWLTTLQGPTGAGREILRITARLDSTEIANLDIGKVCTVTMPRLGLSAGRNYLVTGIQTDAVRGTADLTLWG